MKISQDIEIRTIAGVKFDMMAGETVEVVMGGFSLLDISLRSINYTTSFKLPRTPANENILGFASETSRYNRPIIPVFVRYGSKDIPAYLKVISFSKTYSVRIAFADFFSAMAGFELNEIIADNITNPMYTSGVSAYYEDLMLQMTQNNVFTLFHHYSEKQEPELSEMGIYINQEKIISMICEKAGYTAIFSAEIDLSTKFIFCKDWAYSIALSSGIHALNITKITDKQYKSISVLLKQLCLANALYFDVDELKKEVIFYKMENVLTSEHVSVETLILSEKNHYTGYGARNTIKYSVGDGTLTTTKYATFTADGDVSKEVLQLEMLIPSKVGSIYNLVDVTEIAPASRDGNTIMLYYGDEGERARVSTQYHTPPDLAPIYSFMQTIFADTFLISATGYIKNIDVEKINKRRIIKSLGLGGYYFVETMNYNLNTGKAVLTLIKLS